MERCTYNCTIARVEEASVLNVEHRRSRTPEDNIGHFKLAVLCALSERRIFELNFKQLQDYSRYKPSVQSNKSTSIMERIILPSLSPLIGLLILYAFRGISALISRKHKSIINESLVRGGSALGGVGGRYSRPPRIFIPNVLARWPWVSSH